ncbi:Hypothetical protein SRAE_X000201300 [Strongyloides ratti]|uniref:Uncharacterized protein n=1 Tax=Strongyloides ratti TaxID=34506 RepID=A0A090KS05_STRRB|nr:Hypothetical protein SRAE_X000201300 [Strongyloides ratti]CEF60275.1 Hypothetical protein SRAE_X000201300 [Strongyloides ratti]
MREVSFKGNTVIISIRNEKLIDICDYVDSNRRLKVTKEKVYGKRKFKEVAIVRSIEKIKGCSNTYKSDGFLVSTYSCNFYKVIFERICL